MTRTRFGILSATIAALTLFSACAKVPILSLPRLAALSPQSMDLSQTEVAVRMQDSFRPRQDSATLNLSLTAGEAGEVIEETFILAEIDAPLTRFLSRQEKEGYIIRRFRLKEDDIERVNALRDRIALLKETSPGGNSFTAEAFVKACRVSQVDPGEALRLTMYLRTDRAKDFFTLMKEMDFTSKTDTPASLCKE